MGLKTFRGNTGAGLSEENELKTSIHGNSCLQGLCQMASEVYQEPAQVIRLWVHECERVLADRMISQADLNKFMDMRLKATRKYFPEVPEVGMRALQQC